MLEYVDSISLKNGNDGRNIFDWWFCEKGEEEGMLKNNNDKYFTKEDLAYYEQIRHNTEKKTVVHRDKNIR